MNPSGGFADVRLRDRTSLVSTAGPLCSRLDFLALVHLDFSVLVYLDWRGLNHTGPMASNSPPRPPLSSGRIVAALVVAVGADVVPYLLGPLGWTFADEVVDVIAMAAEALLLGFHVLLLPTFLLELLPLVDALPTWTACVLAVIALRRRKGATPSSTSVVPSN